MEERGSDMNMPREDEPSREGGMGRPADEGGGMGQGRGVGETGERRDREGGRQAGGTGTEGGMGTGRGPEAETGQGQ